jgi:hypothetical protein
MNNYDQCHAEFIDGSWDTSMCGCPNCIDDEHDEIERQHEAGHISHGEALDAHNRIDLGGDAC